MDRNQAVVMADAIPTSAYRFSLSAEARRETKIAQDGQQPLVARLRDARLIRRQVFYGRAKGRPVVLGLGPRPRGCLTEAIGRGQPIVAWRQATQLRVVCDDGVQDVGGEEASHRA